MSKRVLILVGSGTAGSRSLNLGRTIEQQLATHNLEAELVDLLKLGLPMYNATTEKTDAYDPKTRDFLNKSHQVDGFVWVTPVYHNSFSSVLKTALDWQHFMFDGKVLGLASHGGRSPAAVDQLLMPARAQHFVTIPSRICTDNDDYDEQKQLINPEILERIQAFASEFTNFLQRFGE